MSMGRLALVSIAAVLSLSLAVARLAGQTSSAAADAGAAAIRQTADSQPVTATAVAGASSAPAGEQTPATTIPAPSDQARRLIDLPPFAKLSSGFAVSPDGVYAAVPVISEIPAAQPTDKPIQRMDIYLVDLAILKVVAVSEKMPGNPLAPTTPVEPTTKPADSTTEPTDSPTTPGDTTTRPVDSTAAAAGPAMQVLSPQFSPDSKYMTFQTVSGEDRHVSLWLMDLSSPSAFDKGPARGKTITCLAEGKAIMSAWVGKKIALGATDKIGYFQPIKFINASTLGSEDWPVKGYVASADSKGKLIVCICMADNPRGQANSDELNKLNAVLIKPDQKGNARIVKTLSIASEMSSMPIFSPGLKYVAYQRNRRKSTGRVTMDVGAVEVVALEGNYTRTITEPELPIHVTDGGRLFSLGTGPAGTSPVIKVRDKSGKASVLFEAASAAVANNTIYYVKTGDAGSQIMSVTLPGPD